MSRGHTDSPEFLFRQCVGAVEKQRRARILIFLVFWLPTAHRLPWHWFTFDPPAEVLAAEFRSEDLPEDADPPAVAVGERLFLETRFAQFFFANLARTGNLRNPDPEIGRIRLTPEDMPLLRAFLQA